MVVGALILTAAGCAAVPCIELDGERRWTEVLSAAEAEPDALARSRARVEALYGAGDLPGALRAAAIGLGAGGDDPQLLRRACQLALSLRMADAAEENARRLSASLAAADLDAAQREWWRAEARALQTEAAALREHERILVAATRRARSVSVGMLGAVLLGLVVLARRS